MARYIHYSLSSYVSRCFPVRICLLGLLCKEKKQYQGVAGVFECCFRVVLINSMSVSLVLSTFDSCKTCLSTRSGNDDLG